MDNDIAIFIAGVAAGLALYRGYVALVISRPVSTKCDLCEYANKNKSRR